MPHGQSPGQTHRSGRDDDRETAQEREAVAVAGRCKDAGRTVKVPVEQRREGAKAEGLVNGRGLERVGHRRRMTGGNGRNKGRGARRA